MKFKYDEKWNCGWRANEWDVRGDESRKFTLEDGRTGCMRVYESVGGWNGVVMMDDDTIVYSSQSWGERRKAQAMSFCINKFREWVAAQ